MHGKLWWLFFHIDSPSHGHLPVSSVTHTRCPALQTGGLCRGRLFGLERWVFAFPPGLFPSQGLVGSSDLSATREVSGGLRVDAAFQATHLYPKGGARRPDNTLSRQRQLILAVL